MKKIHLFILAFFVFSKSYCQFYDLSYFSAGGSNPFGHSWMHLDDFQNDRYGNRFSLITEQDCYPCPIEQYISWEGPSGSGGFNFTYGSSPDFKMFADNIGDLFLFGTISGSPTIYGTVLTLGSGEKALIKSGNPSYAMITNANSVSVNDSGYCFTLRSDSIKLYSPAGVLLWARPGGGSQIFGIKNLSYIVNTSSGITKYRKNGTIAWQSSITGDFRVTPQQRVVVKQGGTVYELSTPTGQVLSIHAGATQGSMWDNEGNAYSYSGNTLTKYDSTGIKWQTHLTGTSFDHVGIDRHNNIYFANNYLSHNQNSFGEWVNPPIPIFVPPTLFIDPLPLNGTNWGYYAAYSGRINQQNQLNEKITTGKIKAICKKSITPVPFTVNQFRVGFENGFRAEISDAWGYFADPVVIGTGFVSPIAANTSFFNTMGNNYRIRVVANIAWYVPTTSVKIPQAVYPPKAEILVSDMFDNSGEPASCQPAILIAPPGNYTYQWSKKLYSTDGYFPVSTSNDSITISNSAGDSYKVIITDTATGCPSTGWRPNFYTYSNNGGIVLPDFILPPALCVNEGPFDLYSGMGGEFMGNGVSNNKFYPDSVGPGQHAIQWHTNNPAPCFSTADTTKFINVDTCVKAISAVHISPVKEAYCIGDTIIVTFDYDSALFNAANNFKVQLGIGYSTYGSFSPLFIIGTKKSSPITCILTDNIYYSGDDYRIRIVSTSPALTGAFNYEGNLKIGAPDDASLTPNANLTNCAPANTWISVTQGSSNSPVYYWHFNNQTIVDSVLLEKDGYFNIPVSHGSTFFANQNGKYSVEIVNQYGCHSFSDTLLIGSSPIPFGTVSPDSASFCPGDSALITLQTYTVNMVQWFKNNIAFSPPDPYSFYVTEGGQYSVILTNPLSLCNANMENIVNIDIKPLPNTTITAPGSTTRCEGNMVTLNAYSSSNYHYQWMKDGVDLTGMWSHAATYHASVSGTYKVRITDIVTGCTGTTTNGIVVTIKPLPPAIITPQGPVTFCAGDSVILSANTGTGLTYKWKLASAYITGATAADYTAYTAGDYQVEVTKTGCSATSTVITVTVPCRLSEDDAENENAFKATVSPNPSSGDFVFEFSNAASENISIEILDVVGKTILKVTVSGAEYVIRKEQLSAGIYSVVISDGIRQKELKLVKTD